MDDTARSNRGRLRPNLTRMLGAVTVVAVALCAIAVAQWNRADDRAAVAATQAARAAQLADEERSARRAADLQAEAESRAREEAEAQRIASMASEEDARLAEIQAEEDARLARARALTIGAEASLSTDPDLSLLLAVEALQLDPTSPHALTALHDGLRSAHTSLLLRSAPEEKPAGSLSPDGRYLALATHGDTLELRDLADSAAIVWSRDFPGDVEVIDPAFTGDGTRVVVLVRWSRSSGGQPPIGFSDAFRYIDVATGADVESIAVPPCVERMALAGQQHVMPTGTIYVLSSSPSSDGCDSSIRSAGYLHPLDGVYVPMTDEGDQPSGRPTISTDGRYLAFGGSGEVIDTTSRRTVFRPGTGVSSLHPDGSRVIAGGIDGTTMTVWDIATGDLIGTLPGTDGAVEAWYSDDGSIISVLAQDGSVLLHDGNTLGRMTTLNLPAPPDHHVLSDDGTTVAAFSTDGSVRVAEIRPPAWGEVATLYLDQTGRKWASSISVAGDLATVTSMDSTTNRATATLFRPSTGEVVDTFDAWHSAELSPDGSLMAIQPMYDDVDREDGTYQRMGRIRIIDTRYGRTTANLEGLCEWFGPLEKALPGEECDFPDPVMDFGRQAFSADGALIALAGWKTQSLTVWDVASGALLWNSGRLGEGEGDIDAAFSPDGGVVVVGTRTATTILDASTGRVRAQLAASTESFSMMFSSDGTTLYTIDGGGLRVIDTATWQETVRWGNGAVVDADLSPDGTRLALAYSSDTVEVIDAATGAALQEIHFPGLKAAGNLAFAGNDRLLVTGTGPGPIAVAALDPETLLDLGRSALVRGFTEAECATHALDPCPTLEPQGG